MRTLEREFGGIVLAVLCLSALGSVGVISYATLARRAGATGSCSWRRTAGLLLAVALVAIAALTLTPLADPVDAHGVNLRLMEGLLHPRGSLALNAVRVGANVALFLPVGALLPVWRPQMGLLATTVAGASFSLAVEILQFLLRTGRISDINDVVLNTAGVCLGGCGTAAVRHLLAKRREA